MKDFWQQYEKKFGEKLPQCVVKLLSECGYNLMSTINDIRAEHIDDIEMFIEQNFRGVIDGLNCCNASTYQNQNQFKFLPAYRNLILGLPAKIQAMKTEGKKNVESRKKKNILTPHNENAEELEVPVIDQTQLTDQILQELLTKLHDFGRSLNLSAVKRIAIGNIVDITFTFGENVIGQCKVMCPYCSHSYLCRYNHIWGTSNLNKHFRSHANENINGSTQQYVNIATHTASNDDADHDNNDNRVDDDDAQLEMEQNENDNDIDMVDEVTNDVQLHRHISFDLGFGTDDEADDDSFRRTIDLRIESLESPEMVETPPRRQLRNRRQPRR